MSDPEKQQTNIETISGITNEIVFDNTDGNLSTFLDDLKGYHPFYRSQAESLAYPVRMASIVGHVQGDDLGFYADLEFDAQSVTGFEITNWRKLIKKHMQKELAESKMSVYTLKHQHQDFYVKLDDVSSAHVQFGSETYTCDISVELVPLRQLIEVSNGEIWFEVDEDDEPFLLDRLGTLRELVDIWSIALDAVTNEFGLVEAGDDPKSRVVIAPPIPCPPNDELADPSDELNDSEIEESETLDDESTAHEQVVAEGFTSIGGLAHAKQRLEVIADIYKDPIGSRRYGLNGSAFVLHGPAGTGKTSLVRAFANEIGGELREVSSTDLIEKWVGNSGKNVVAFFDEIKEAAKKQRIVVFFDEFEALAQKGSGGTQERVDVKKQLNLAVTDIRKNHPNVVIAAATNADIDDLEPSLVRSGRFEPIGAPLPNETERIDVWAAVLTNSIASFSDIDAEALDIIGDAKHVATGFIPYEDDINPVELAALTDGMTGADFDYLLEQARMKHFRAFRKTQVMSRVTQKDLIEQLRLFGR